VNQIRRHLLNAKVRQDFEAKAMAGTRRSINGALHVVAASVALLFMVPAAGAVTCDEVRSLTAASRADWAKRLKVSPENLAILLEQSFCQPKRPSDVIVSGRSFARKSKPS
jgi:hypothetical protein